jgi:hypothetical protein
MTDGVRRGRFVAGDDQARPLTPDVPALFRIDLGPLAVRLVPGQRFRVAIAGTSSPRIEPNSNQAEAPDEPIATTLTLWFDESHPSRLFLPLALGNVPGAELVEPDAGVGDGDGGGDDGGLLEPVVDAGGVSPVDPREDASTGMLEPNGSGADDGCGCRLFEGSRRQPAGALAAAWMLIAVFTRRRTARARGTDHRSTLG